MKITARLLTALLAGVAITMLAADFPSELGDTKPQSAGDHPYHQGPPSGPLPTVLDPDQFKEDRPTFVAYTLARRIPAILYQEPCFCPCHKEQHHQSLLDCFSGSHGVSCYLCKQEVVYCYERNKQNKTARQIRQGLANQEWSHVNVRTYADDFVSKQH